MISRNSILAQIDAIDAQAGSGEAKIVLGLLVKFTEKSNKGTLALPDNQRILLNDLDVMLAELVDFRQRLAVGVNLQLMKEMPESQTESHLEETALHRAMMQLLDKNVDEVMEGADMANAASYESDNLPLDVMMDLKRGFLVTDPDDNYQRCLDGSNVKFTFAQGSHYTDNLVRSEIDVTQLDPEKVNEALDSFCKDMDILNKEYEGDTRSKNRMIAECYFEHFEWGC